MKLKRDLLGKSEKADAGLLPSLLLLVLICLLCIRLLTGGFSGVRRDPLQRSAEAGQGVWEGKKWVAFGDSLTDESINAEKKYHSYIAERTGITVVDMGQGSTGYWRGCDEGNAFYQRMAEAPSDADVITIFGSVNDWRIMEAGISIGTASDSLEDGTLAGYINACIDAAYEAAPDAQVALITPLDYHGVPGDIMEEISDIIMEVAQYRRIKCVDLYHASGFRVDSAPFARTHTTDFSTDVPRYGHPSTLAHETLIAPEFLELLRRMILS